MEERVRALEKGLGRLTKRMDRDERRHVEVRSEMQEMRRMMGEELIEWESEEELSDGDLSSSEGSAGYSSEAMEDGEIEDEESEEGDQVGEEEVVDLSDSVVQE